MACLQFGSVSQTLEWMQVWEKRSNKTEEGFKQIDLDEKYHQSLICPKIVVYFSSSTWLFFLLPSSHWHLIIPNNHRDQGVRTTTLQHIKTLQHTKTPQHTTTLQHTKAQIRFTSKYPTLFGDVSKSGLAWWHLSSQSIRWPKKQKKNNALRSLCCFSSTFLAI